MSFYLKKKNEDDTFFEKVVNDCNGDFFMQTTFRQYAQKFDNKEEAEQVRLEFDEGHEFVVYERK